MSDGKKSRPSKGLTKKEWIGAARQILTEKGIAQVRVRSLARSLGVTTGAFYWRYSSLKELYEELRSDWATRNTEPFARAVKSAGADGWRQYLAYVRVLMLDGEYDPSYDNAVRDWAHSSPETAGVLREVELFRIKLLRGTFEAMGFIGNSALIRARVTYFHQTGYQAMRIHESVEERLANVPYYAEVLTDSRHLFALGGPEAVRKALLETREIEPGVLNEIHRSDPSNS